MPRRTDTAIGVDVGGTRIRAARIDQMGNILARVVETVSADRDDFSDQLLRLIGQVRDATSIGVGIGIPGRVDAGMIKSAGFLDIAGLDLPTLVTDQTGLGVRIENDATMALWAEVHLRGESASELTLMVTIGTGIGGAIFEHGAPWHGGANAGQFGHLVVADDGPICNCGRRGCVETFSSGIALGRLMAEAGLSVETRADELLSRAGRGDASAATILDHWVQPLRRALDTLVSAFDPHLIIIGGGLGEAMTRALARCPGESHWFSLRVEPARLGDDAGVVGAGLCGLGVQDV